MAPVRPGLPDARSTSRLREPARSRSRRQHALHPNPLTAVLPRHVRMCRRGPSESRGLLQPEPHDPIAPRALRRGRRSCRRVRPGHDRRARCMSYVAIIPARGGSKRIPRKNIRPFVGKPIIAWSIQAALESALFERVIVSTDDPEIAATVERYGAEAPFLRPPELSDDRAATTPVVAHALKWLIESGANPAAACCIYPT